MPITTLRESIAFPEAGQIRKGEGKRKIQKNGYEIETVGHDLGCKFRIIFFEGEDNMKSKDRFFENHRDNITMDKDTNFILSPARIVAMFPFSDAFRCWDFWYEAYIASRMVARSDGERFIRLIDPQTGGIKVSNGETFIPYKHGQVVGTYTNTKGKVTEIKCKPVGRLKVVLPELIRMCFMTVFTTSIYDISQITSQLRGLDLIARNIPQSNGVAGIPLALTRRMTSNTWSSRMVQPSVLSLLYSISNRIPIGWRRCSSGYRTWLCQVETRTIYCRKAKSRWIFHRNLRQRKARKKIPNRLTILAKKQRLRQNRPLQNRVVYR